MGFSGVEMTAQLFEKSLFSGIFAPANFVTFMLAQAKMLFLYNILCKTLRQKVCLQFSC